MLNAIPPVSQEAKGVHPTTVPAVAQPFVGNLLAPGPAAAAGENRDLYGVLVGSWAGEWVDHLPTEDVRMSAEVHASWVLEGRALQDLWLVPAPWDRDPAHPPKSALRHGTTLRIYDPKKDRWSVNWFNPVSGVESHLEGRKEGDQIMQTGLDAKGQPTRWIFDEIHPDSFHWRAEGSSDGGKSWVCFAELAALRTVPSPAGPGRTITWRWTDRLGIEQVRLTDEGDFHVAQGLISAVQDGILTRTTYRIAHDAGHRFREGWIRSTNRAGTREISLRRGADGRWDVNGSPRPDLDGCEEVDLMVSPYTNTPALLAAALPEGASRHLKVAWIRCPDLNVHLVEQIYTRLSGEGPSRYQYENLETGFKEVLTVDRDGLVLDYGPWHRR
jgi:hypothetical protein